MDAPDRHNGQRDKQTIGRVSLFLCLLDEVWQNARTRAHTHTHKANEQTSWASQERGYEFGEVYKK